MEMVILDELVIGSEIFIHEHEGSWRKEKYYIYIYYIQSQSRRFIQQ